MKYVAKTQSGLWCQSLNRGLGDGTMKSNRRTPTLIGFIALFVFVALNTIAIQGWHIPGGIKVAHAISYCNRGSFHCGDVNLSNVCRFGTLAGGMACRPCNMCYYP